MLLLKVWKKNIREKQIQAIWFSGSSFIPYSSLPPLQLPSSAVSQTTAMQMKKLSWPRQGLKNLTPLSSPFFLLHRLLLTTSATAAKHQIIAALAQVAPNLNHTPSPPWFWIGHRWNTNKYNFYGKPRHALLCVTFEKILIFFSLPSFGFCYDTLSNSIQNFVGQ